MYVCLYVKSQLREFEYYKIRRELRAKFILILYQINTCESQDIRTIRYNKYQF
jgi:hypothetical protein